MKEIKKYIEKVFKLYVIEHNNIDKDVFYLVTNEFIIIKHDYDYYISFDISLPKGYCFQLYAQLQEKFMLTIHFELYDDCISMIRDDEIIYFSFGRDAEEAYYNNIKTIVEQEQQVPDGAIFH